MDIVTYIEKLNWPTIIAMFAIVWFFTRDLRATLHKIDNDVRDQGKRIDRLYEMFIDLLKSKKDE
jgi:hypothetical protein